MNAFFLWILDRFRWLFQILGADYYVLRAIVGIKLTMDNRRQLVNYQSKSGKETNYSFIIALFIYGLFGIFTAIIIYAAGSTMLGMIVFYSYVMVMVAMTLISDFSSVLLDTSDNTIILPRPVTGRTLFLARVTHILLYLSQVAFALSVAPLVVVIIKYNLLVWVVFAVGIALAVLTAVALTNAVYMLILQFSSEEKLKNLINYFQIVMAILIMGGYQLLPRVMNFMNLDEPTFNFRWWMHLIPSTWMSGLVDGVAQHTWDGHHLISALLALGVPLATLYIVNRYLTPVFTRKLSSLGTAAPTESVHKKKSGWMEWLSRWFTRTPLERATFGLVYQVLGRDRQIKLKIYPSYGYVVIFSIIFIVRSDQGIGATLASLPDTKFYLLLLYMAYLIVQTGVQEIAFSEEFKASWPFYAAPIDKPGELLLGTIKALMVRLFVPAFIVLSSAVLLIWGLDVVDDVIFALCSNVLMILAIAAIGPHHLPLSAKPSLRAQTGNTLRAILGMIIVGALGGIHYAFAYFELWWMFWVALPIQIVLIVLLARSYRRVSWDMVVA